MSKLLYHDNDISVSFYCPACKKPHTINNTWDIKDANDIVTISPSILYHGTSELFPEKNIICHSFIRNSKIEYLNDCTHNLAGKTVELPPMPIKWK